MYGEHEAEYGELLVNPEEARLRTHIYALGIQPEFLSQMPVEDARTVLTGMAKLVSTITHSDRNSASGRIAEIAGLDAAAANAIGSEFRTADSALLEKVLRNLNSESPLAAEQALRQELITEHDALLARSRELINRTLTREAPLHKFTGKIALYAPSGAINKENSYTAHLKSIFEITLENGSAKSGLIYSGRGLLVSKLSKRAQEFATSEYTIGDTDKILRIDKEHAEDTELPEGWVRLTYARSKSDFRKKAPAVYLYDEREAYDDSGMEDARLVGTFEYTEDTTAQELSPSKQLAARKFDAIRRRNYSRVSKAEMIQLILDGRMELFSSTQEPLSPPYLSWFRPAGHGKQETGFLTHGSLGQYSSSTS